MKRYWVVGPAGNICNTKAFAMGSAYCEVEDEAMRASLKAYKGLKGGHQMDFSIILEEVMYAKVATVTATSSERGTIRLNDFLEFKETMRELAPYGADIKLPTYPPEVQEEIDRVLIDAEKRAKLETKLYVDEARKVRAEYDELRAKASAIKEWIENHIPRAEKLKELLLKRRAELDELNQQIEERKA
jgi:wyosine [tRNA(Phe)-imidazoG37] synthetase (radical SAM superfamily)